MLAGIYSIGNAILRILLISNGLNFFALNQLGNTLKNLVHWKLKSYIICHHQCYKLWPVRFIATLLFASFALFTTCALKKEHFTPVAYSGKIALPVIVLDPGHGGVDLGAKIHYPYCEEKRLTLRTTLLTKRYLESKGYKVILTRYRDQQVPLKNRVDRANRINSDVFVSIHFNSCPTPEVHGIEIYYPAAEGNYAHRETSRKLAVSVLKSVLAETGAASRGVRKKDFMVIRDTTMPAILVEGGFLTNFRECNRLRQRVYLEHLAMGIAEGIDNFVQVHTH